MKRNGNDEMIISCRDIPRVCPPYRQYPMVAYRLMVLCEYISRTMVTDIHGVCPYIVGVGENKYERTEMMKKLKTERTESDNKPSAQSRLHRKHLRNLRAKKELSHLASTLMKHETM